jgi:hypothetical protein
LKLSYGDGGDAYDDGGDADISCAFSIFIFFPLTISSRSYDYDVDPLRRRHTPDFYGFIPDDGTSRGIIFGCMIVNSFSLLLIRSMCAALLMTVDTSYFAWYMACDLSFYIGLKIARGDFIYWIPAKGLLGIFISMFMRLAVKIVADYTAISFFRHPGEMGGLYWTCSMFLALATSSLALSIYYRSSNVEAKFMEEERAWIFAALVGAMWLISFLVFVLFMKKEFRGTFFSTKLGRTAIVERFDVDDEQVKSSILKKNEKLWRSVEDDVRDWVTQNWNRWEEEQPVWFTEAWKSRVPDEWLPRKELVRQSARGGGKRRRSSLINDVMGDASFGSVVNGVKPLLKQPPHSVQKQLKTTSGGVLGTLLSSTQDHLKGFKAKPPQGAKVEAVG